MNNYNPGFLRVGALGAGCVCVGIALAFSNAVSMDEWDKAVVVASAGLLGIGAVLFSPIVGHVVEWWWVDLPRKRREAACPPAPKEPPRPTETQHTRAWRHFLLLCAWRAVELGSVSFQSMKDFFGGDQKAWRAFVDRLVEWGVCWPVQQGNETFLKPGQTPTLIYDMLAGGEMPPCPVEYPPVLRPRPTETVKTPAKQ